MRIIEEGNKYFGNRFQSFFAINDYSQTKTLVPPLEV